ncbi:unnamed protein product [Rotaria socialis]|uniref:PARP catalytic domain-containing protein n=1 Tax=Rotaria socialis TaxID=392032 RepID=A0A817WPV5_9BILA|nr:unnamed protein product [Rotaria socialis]CAF4657801.1 unnamed protein product [Rotaria socialis]
MCCCHCSWLYRKLPYLHALTDLLEMIFVIVHIALFFSPLSTNKGVVPKEYSKKYVSAFIIDWISSIIPTLVGLFTALIILVILWKLFACCINVHYAKLFKNKALRRFVIADCNCPCYKSRPGFRCQIRFALLFIFFTLRIVAIGLYATAAPSGDNDSGSLAGICAFSLTFIFNTLCLDFYRYYVWWHYSPQDDNRCHCRSKKHERYLPYHMVGEYRDSRMLGDRPCRDKPCHKRTLDHIAVFHSSDFQPQDHWRDIPQPPAIIPSKNSKLFCLKSKEENNQTHYIGFHTTDPTSAISIAHSDFRSGKNGWLGPGVYFARSIDGTIGKAKSSGGAHIIAEIRMGKVLKVEREVITRSHLRFNAEMYVLVHHMEWQENYDTCCMTHEHDHRDEFAIKDAATQIIKWVIVIDQEFDPKVEKYELTTEFDSTTCGCI